MAIQNRASTTDVLRILSTGSSTHSIEFAFKGTAQEVGNSATESLKKSIRALTEGLNLLSRKNNGLSSVANDSKTNNYENTYRSPGISNG